MEYIYLIIAILGLIPVYFIIRRKLWKGYKFDLDYKKITIASLSSPQNPNLDKRLCIIIYVLHIVNNSDESRTLKNVTLSYRFNGKIYETESYVVPTGILPKSGKPSIVLSNGTDNVYLMSWQNIRPKLGKYETLLPGGVFSGSAVFLFESHIKDIHCVNNIKLIVCDFYGKKSIYPILINEEWLVLLNKGFALINKAFTIKEDDTIQWE